jgi:integrase
MGHLRRAESRSWEARYRGPDGREHSRRFRTRREAQAFLERTGADQQRGEWRDPEGAKVLTAAWVDAWWATTVNLRPSSRARDEAYIRNHVLPAFGELPLGAITQLDVRAWVADLDASGRAPATVQKAYQTLSKILRGAVDAGLIAQSPCRRIGLPRIEREEMRFLGPAEISALAEAIEPRYRAMVLFDAYCGLRLGELAGLRRSRVDLLRRQVRVTEIAVEVKGELIFGPPMTRAGQRKVPLPRFVADEMAAHLDTYGQPDPGSLVFVGPDGGALRASGWRARQWRPAIRAAGLEPLRPHDLRHTAVSLWVAAGASPKQIATWAGHTSVAVVLDRYGHLFPGHEEGVLDRLEGFARSVPPTGIAADEPGGPRGAAGFPRGERKGREPGSSRHSAVTSTFTVGDGGFEPSTSAV